MPSLTSMSEKKTQVHLTRVSLEMFAGIIGREDFFFCSGCWVGRMRPRVVDIHLASMWEKPTRHWWQHKGGQSQELEGYGLITAPYGQVDSALSKALLALIVNFSITFLTFSYKTLICLVWLDLDFYHLESPLTPLCSILCNMCVCVWRGVKDRTPVKGS